MMVESRSRLLVVALFLLAAAVVACSGGPQPAGDHEQDGGYGRWAAEEPESWPRIAMVNRIRYSDSDHPVGPSAFLLQNGDEIVAVTAKHVLRFFKSEAMDSISFRGTLVNWEMYPKDAPTDITVVGALINEDEGESLESIRPALDWLLFTVESASENVTPLRLRTTRLKKGETVFVVGWRYTDEGRQRVYRGEYVRSEKGSVLIDVEELEDNTVPGLSGAPVIDARGYVVGLMSQKSGEFERLAGVGYPRKVLDETPRPETPSRSAAGNVESAGDCARQMTEHFSRSGWIGITPEDDEAGVTTVAEVFAGSPADTAGIRHGDIIRDVKGAPSPGATVVFELERDGAALSIDVLAETIPETVLEQWIRQECSPAPRSCNPSTDDDAGDLATRWGLSRQPLLRDGAGGRPAPRQHPRGDRWPRIEQFDEVRGRGRVVRQAADRRRREVPGGAAQQPQVAAQQRKNADRIAILP